jgi:phage terminase large subunit-like protein
VAQVASRALGKYERLSQERHERDLELAQQPSGHPRKLWFDAPAGDRAVQFVEGYCQHHKGEWAGKPLLLSDWQRSIVRQIFGWKRADGTRRYRIAYVEVPRKNGKSTLAAALGLYLLVGDQEPGAEVYSSATKREQAKIVWDEAFKTVKKSPKLQRFVRAFRNNLHCERLGSKFEPLSADAGTLDGLNPHGNIIDELHAHKDRGVWDVLDTAMGARRQPLTLAITTAGTYDPESIGWQQHDYACKVLEGVVQDDVVLCVHRRSGRRATTFSRMPRSRRRIPATGSA